MKNIVTNIQRFCLQDGPGIRTTVFLKGCNLKCPWCSNPENISFDIEKSVDGSTIYGREYSCDELFDEIIRDKLYYETNGGVTFSGGESLWHIFEIEPLLKKLVNNNISIAIETTLSTPQKYVELALKYVNYFLVDIKILTNNSKSLINLDSSLFISNVNYLLKQNSNVKFRIPLVKDYTYTSENIELINLFLKKNKIKEIEVFKIHEFAKKKYESLGKKIKHFDDITDKDIDELKRKLNDININVLTY